MLAFVRLRYALAVAVLAAGCSSASRPALEPTGKPIGDPAPTAHLDQAPSYLALGDSVVFGFRLNSPNYKATDSFIGYPTYVGSRLHLSTTNASCPGEATGGFIATSSPIDNGCKFFKSQFGLHVHYTGSQLDYAVSFLKSHPQTKLVTLGLGANDDFLLQQQCRSNAACLKSAATKLGAQIVGNLETILRALRATGYEGKLLVTNYYSLDYTDTAMTTMSNALNQAVNFAAGVQHVQVVDVFDAFKEVANRLAHGNTCTAGLLNRMSRGPNGCDVHPSTAGQKLIATTVVAAYLNS